MTTDSGFNLAKCQIFLQLSSITLEVFIAEFIKLISRYLYHRDKELLV